MTPFDLGVFAAKLILGTTAFLVIGYLCASDDRRVAGAMLAFPVLNGLGPLTSPDKDPLAVAQSMMPMIALNAVLFFGFITAFRWARRRGGGVRALSYGIGIAGAAVWFMVASLAMPALDPLLPAPGAFLVLYALAAAAMTLAIWQGRPAAAGADAPRSEARPDFVAFWRQRRWRLAFFIASLLLLLAAANISGAGWVGRLSALPLVPLCVLAGLAIDDADGLPAIRDPIFIGPGVAMIFAWAFTLSLIPLQTLGGVSYWVGGIAGIAAGWAAYFLVIRYGVPPLAAAMDRARA